MINWLKYSGVWVTLICNPFHWRISLLKNSVFELPSPNRTEYGIQLFMLSIRIVLDDGSW